VLLNKEVEKDLSFCHLKLIQHTKEFVTKFESEVVQLKEVLECYHVSGDYDYIQIVVRDMEAYRESHKINNTSAYW
jgi:Lrp/AsnC family leucine-responsive transcriptional regulator